MEKRRGRPTKSDVELLNKIILQYKDDIIKNNKIVSRIDTIWQSIANLYSEQLNVASCDRRAKSASALYTYVTCNKNNIKVDLYRDLKTADDSSSAENTQEISNLSQVDDSLNITDINAEGVEFLLHMPGTEFDKLLEVRIVKDKSRSMQKRTRRRLIKDKWTRWINEKIFHQTRRSCGYYFDYQHINSGGNSGHICGHCNCGSKLEIYLQRNNENVITLKCNITEGNKSCGKIYLRGAERRVVAEKLQTKSAFAYRAEQANVLLEEGQTEVAILPRVEVLRLAKHQCANMRYVDADPIQALHKMKISHMKYIIYNISLSPFMIHYSTKHQDTMYKVLNNAKNLTLAIDATGSLIRPLILPDGTKSGPIFLYVIVAKSPKGSTPVAQMLSEKHTTNAICYWLGEWTSNAGLPYPYEIVCDGAKALLGACVRSFTTSKNISEYSDSLALETMPQCYIRIDVAHFLKKYANFLSAERGAVKKFFLAVVGKLILARSKDEAQKITQALMTVALSENDGYDEDGKDSACLIQKTFLLDLLSSNVISDRHMESEYFEGLAKEAEHDNDDIENGWFIWAKDIKTVVETNIHLAAGSSLNAYFLPKLVKYLMKDLPYLPMWSCVVRDKFGYGRVPASSAHVEAEFRNIKKLWLKNETLPVRVDYFVEKHVDHLKGTTKLFDAALQNKIVSDTVVNQSPDIIDNNTSLFESCLACQTIILDSDNILCDKCSAALSVTGNDVENILVEEVQQQSLLTKCPACKRGDEASGAHKCVICDKAVHALDLCSLPFEMDEEGFGQRRICLTCNEQTNKNEIFDMRAEENWGGQVKRYKKDMEKKDKSCGIYLREKYPINKLLDNPVLSTVPILKSGESKHLKAVKKGKESYIDLINTCAFDSLFQLLLSTCIDNSRFLENVIIKNSRTSLLCELLAKTCTKKINAQSYRLRMKILSEIFPKKGDIKSGCFVVDCQTTTTDLCKRLLSFEPSFIEFINCPNNCNKREIITFVSMVSLNAILAENWNEAVEKNIQTESSSLCPKCQTYQTKMIKANDNMILIEVVDLSMFDDLKVEVQQLPQTLKLSFMADEMVLRGVVNFKAPQFPTCISDVGHYTAFYFRQGSWFEVDEKEYRRAGTTKVTPHLVLYAVNAK